MFNATYFILYCTLNLAVVLCAVIFIFSKAVSGGDLINGVNFSVSAALISLVVSVVGGFLGPYFLPIEIFGIVVLIYFLFRASQLELL